VSLGKPGVYAAVTGSIRLESLFLTLEGSGFELVVCVKFSKLVVGAGTGSFQVNSNIPLFDRLAGCRKRIQVFRMPVSPSGRRFRCGPVAAARVRNTVSASGNGMLPTKWTIGLCAGAALIAALSPQPTFARFPADARPGSPF